MKGHVDIYAGMLKSRIFVEKNIGGWQEKEWGYKGSGKFLNGIQIANDRLLIDGYLRMLDNLSPVSKLDLISRLLFP